MSPWYTYERQPLPTTPKIVQTCKLLQGYKKEQFEKRREKALYMGELR